MADYVGLLQGYGLTPVASAGIVGNGMIESNMDPTIIEGGGHANEIPVNGTHGYGIFQYTSADRQQGLADFAKSLGISSGSPEAQFQYMLKELGPDGINKLNSFETPEQAAVWFHDNFERSADTDLYPRQKAARDAFSQAGSPTSMTRYQNNNPQSQNFAFDDPNEKLDWDKINKLMNYQVASPEVEAARAMQAGRIAGLRNSSYFGEMGTALSRNNEDQMKALVNQAISSANTANNQQKLTNAGKLAQMIADSHNSSNSKMLASFGQALGVHLDPMADRYMNNNQMAMLNMKRQQGLDDQAREFNQKKELMDIQYQQQKELQDMKAAQAIAIAGMRRGSSAGAKLPDGSYLGSDGQPHLTIAQQNNVGKILAAGQEDFTAASDADWAKTSYDGWKGSVANTTQSIVDKLAPYANTVEGQDAIAKVLGWQKYDQDAKTKAWGTEKQTAYTG